MNKYQEVLNKIVKSCCPNCSTNGCKGCTIEKICNATAKQWVDTLQELVDKTKTPTLEEVKKEWEELGYEWRTPIDYPHMIYLVDNDDDELKWVLSIKINTQSKKYWKIWGDEVFASFTFEEHNLLTKTFRALGWFDE